jgi:hypothetical protein
MFARAADEEVNFGPGTDSQIEGPLIRIAVGRRRAIVIVADKTYPTAIAEKSATNRGC